MTELSTDNAIAANGGGEPNPEGVPELPPNEDSQQPLEAQAAAAASGSGAAFVKGRIEIEDEVAEKVSALAALEVVGVADLGGDVERAIESVRERIGVGQKRGDQGVKAKVEDKQVAIDVTIVVEYGVNVMEVARNVKANVARAVNHMLSLRVVEVNVTVDDVDIPGGSPLRGSRKKDDDSAGSDE